MDIRTVRHEQIGLNRDVQIAAENSGVTLRGSRINNKPSGYNLKEVMRWRRSAAGQAYLKGGLGIL